MSEDGDAGGSGGEEEEAEREIDLGPLKKAVEEAQEELRIAQEEVATEKGNVLSMEKATTRMSTVVGFFKDKVDTFFDVVEDVVDEVVDDEEDPNPVGE